MNRLLKYVLGIFLSASIWSVSAQDNTRFVIYGDESALANNLVITIDDCSIEENTRRIFEILKGQSVKGVFFPNTRYITQHDPQLWRDILAAGFEIGYHTRRHTSSLTSDQLAQDFAEFQNEMRQILGDSNFSIRYVRPPNGVWDENWLNWADAAGLYTVRWSYTAPAADTTFVNDVLHRGGSILLMHTGLDDVGWLEQNLPTLMTFTTSADTPYLMTNLSTALND